MTVPVASSGSRVVGSSGRRQTADGPPDYWPGRVGVVLLVDSGTRTAHSWAYHRRLSLRGVGVTPPMVRLHTRAVGSAKSGSETMSSQSWVSAWP